MQTISLVLLKEVVVCLHVSGVNVRQFLRWLQQRSFFPVFRSLILARVFLKEGFLRYCPGRQAKTLLFGEP